MRGRRHTNLIGQVFGELTVIGFSHIDSGGNAMWKCNCECGGETTVRKGGLTGSPGTESCGCLQLQPLTHCRRGHEFTQENSYLAPSGSTKCRTCKVSADANWAKEHPERRKEIRRKWRAKNPAYGKSQWNAYHTKKVGSGGSFTAAEWKALCKKYGHKCLCCKRRKKLTADHVIPVSKGGTSNSSNIQPLCGPCNSKKGAKCTDYRSQEYGISS